MIVSWLRYFVFLYQIGFSYMVEKNRKLYNQFDVEASSSSHSALSCEKPIFRGISIFVDGFTSPSSQACYISNFSFSSIWLLSTEKW